MLKILLPVLLCLFTFGTALHAQAGGQPSSNSSARDKPFKRLVFRRPNLSKHAKTGDVPTSGVRARVLEAKAPGAPSVPLDPRDVDVGVPPAVEEEEPPAEPDSRPEPEVPTFFGEPVLGNFVLCLDRSGSMASYGLSKVKWEAVKLLESLNEESEFAIVSFGMNPMTTSYPARIKATSGNVEVAIQEVNSLMAGGGTPAHPALKISCEQYNEGDGIQHLFFLCDGAPNAGGGPEQIMQDFPKWWEAGPKRSDCKLHCIFLGRSDPFAVKFMQALANIVGGEYRKG